jgi:uncharacterized membrane protein YgcG
LFFLVFGKCVKSYASDEKNYSDTGHIVHALDGSITEWPASWFHLNEDSTVEYAAHNDNQNLYVAMNIPDFGEQMKLMRNGMKLYIDVKGKKKVGRGIEFPIKGEGNDAGLINTHAGNGQQNKFDKKTTRNMMALGLVALKLFGFNHDEDEQGLTTPGSVNIAFKWDESDAMHIEYSVPLILLGELASLNQKDISLGWTINGFERPATKGSNFENSENAEGNGRGGGFSRGAGGGGGRGQYGGGRGFGKRPGAGYKKIDPDEMRKEQNFWTKYIINILPAQKAF